MRLAGILLVVISLLSACGGPAPRELDAPEPTGTQSLAQVLADLDALAAPAGTDTAQWSQLKSALAAALRSSGKSKFVSAIAPPNKSTVSDFAITSDGSSATLTWSYRNVADYDQNGEVNVSDLTPLGPNLGATSSSPNWVRAQVCDGDANGAVTISDLTPLGGNLQNSVNGYRIEFSATGADPWIELAEVAVADGVIPTGGGVRSFTYVHQTPQDGSYRLLLYAGAETGASSNTAAYPPLPAWHVEVIENAQARQGVAVFDLNGAPAVMGLGAGSADSNGANFRLAADPQALNWHDTVNVFSKFFLGGLGPKPGVSGGLPCFAIGDRWSAVSSEEKVSFYRAGDSFGDTWGAEIVVAVDPIEVNELVFAVIAGRPAVCYSHDLTEADSAADSDREYNLEYVIATDETGSSWSAPQLIAGNVMHARPLGLVEAAGTPGVVYSAYVTSSDSDHFYTRASDAAGTTWSAPHLLVAGKTKVSAPVVADGHPAVALRGYDPDTQISFVRATDAEGTAWAAPVPVTQDPTSNYDVSLAVVDGRPAVAYFQGNGAPGSHAAYRQALDAAGGQWSTTAELVFTPADFDVAQSYHLADIAGRPALVFSGGDNLYRFALKR